MTREQIIILVLAFPDLLLRNNYSWHASLFWFYCMNQFQWVCLTFVCFTTKRHRSRCLSSERLHVLMFWFTVQSIIPSFIITHFVQLGNLPFQRVFRQYFKSCLHQSWATASQNVWRRWIYDSVREKLNKYKKGWKVLAKLFPVLGVITEWLWLLSSYKLSTLHKWDSIIWIEVGFRFFISRVRPNLLIFPSLDSLYFIGIK